MKKMLVVLGLASVLALSACGNQKGASHADSSMGTEHSSMGDMGEMGHSGTGQLPPGVKEATNSTYKVGDQVIIHADHMAGMNGAKATVSGAYDTVAYAVTYTPATGGDQVPNHKWVIQEEIKDAGSEPLKPGSTVTLEADHMKGMRGAQGTIDSAEKTTVYMVDYTPTDGGQPVKNHQWVVESELSKSE